MYVSQDGGKSWKKMSEGLTKDKQADDYKVPHFMDLKIVFKFHKLSIIRLMLMTLLLKKVKIMPKILN
jgi:hypothetical protein